MSTSKKIFLVFYILLMTIAFTTRYGDIQFGYEIQYIVSFIILFITFICLLQKKDLNRHGVDFKFFFKLYFLPHLFIHLYTIFLMLCGKVEWSNFTLNTSVYVPTLLALSSLYLFGKDSLKYNFIALLFSWCLSVFVSLCSKGFAIFPHAIYQAYFDPLDTTGGLTANYLELHDLILSLGYMVIYYVYSKANHKTTKNNMLIVFFVLLILFLGMKRISLLGIFCSLFFFFVIRHFSDEKKYSLCKFSGILIFLGCYFFVYLIFNGNWFYNFMAEHNINLMGRNYYFQTIIRYGRFAIDFLGIGRNSVSNILVNQYAYLRVGGVHSDIIKMFVENGFVVFGLWLWYYLVRVTKKYYVKFGTSSAVLYFLLIIYTFVLYFTDNTETYFICQFFSILIPITYVICHNDLKQKEKL